MSDALNPALKTSARAFAQYGPHLDDRLLAVRPDISAIDALEYAACYLSSVQALAQDRTQHDESAYATIYLLEAAQAMLNSVVNSMMKEVDHV